MVKRLAPFLAVIFFVAGLFIVLTSIKETQIVKNKAVNTGGVGSMSLAPLTASHNIGDLFPVNIQFNTGGASISSIALRLIYRFTGTTPQMDVTDATGTLSNEIIPDATLLSSGKWDFPVKSVTRDAAAGTVTIDFAAVNTDTAGFSSTTDIHVGTIYFKAINSEAIYDPVAVSFDSTQTRMISKSTSNDILNTPSNGIYNIIPPFTSFSFGFKMQGTNIAHISKDITVRLSDSQGFNDYTISITSDSNGVFRPSQTFQVPVGTFDISVKDSSHLRKKLGTIQIINGSNLAPADWDSEIMKTADFNNDNVLNILDIAKWLTVYTALSNPVNAANQQYDLNNDGVVNITDIALILANYTQLSIPGD